MGQVASFHLVREPRRRALHSFVHLAIDRRGLARTPGLRFWRLMGTGRGSTTSLSIDPRRRALFAVWDDAAALDAFLATSPVAAAWASAEEMWTVRLHGVGGHGTWHGFDVVGSLGQTGLVDGPVAILTRAAVRPGAWARFAADGRAVSREVNAAQGLLAVVAIGEAPLGRQATFSLWSSSDAARHFAYAGGPHGAVVERTRREHWYGEELFARLGPFSSEGSWNGVDPFKAPR